MVPLWQGAQPVISLNLDALPAAPPYWSSDRNCAQLWSTVPSLTQLWDTAGSIAWPESPATDLAQQQGRASGLPDQEAQLSALHNHRAQLKAPPNQKSLQDSAYSPGHSWSPTSVIVLPGNKDCKLTQPEVITEPS